MTVSFEKDCKTLSVPCGDSSPKGRAEGLDAAIGGPRCAVRSGE